ncbi:hypothetical protein [Mycoplasma sp. P36-A1]|uniref:hypothetical protein n=1 Tax=Mycoplasma sp. P36-A1 TaxID=3252900 RepID=UPI003C2CF7CE
MFLLNKYKNLVFMSFLLVLALMFSAKVDAKVQSFTATTGSTWAYASSRNTKSDTLKTAWVHWQSSSKSKHKQWFRVVNSDGAVRGESLLNYLQNKTFSTTQKKGYYAWLKTKREHMIDPITKVSGRWDP